MSLAQRHLDISKARTLAGILRLRANSDGADEPALRYHIGKSWRTLSWRQYWAEACRAASALESVGVRRGARILLLTPDVTPCVRFIFGAWILGAVPIQVGLPYRITDPVQFVAQLRGLAKKLDATRLVVSGPLAAFADGAEREGTLPIHVAEQLFDRCTEPDTSALPDPDAAPDPALIQLTSGSTGHPRGVVIPHEHLVRHLRAMSLALRSPDHAVGVTWLPLHHDMGFIGGLLYPLYNGFVDHLFSPLDFRQNPFVWLEALSEVRATISPAPPSGFALALRMAKKAVAAELDLSSWECAMVGAEPIPADLLQSFADQLAPCGFRLKSFFPVYGLAEATVAVTFPKLHEAPSIDRVSRAAIEEAGRAVVVHEAAPDALSLVGCGAALPGTDLRIVDDDGRELEERRVGEIVFRSNSAMTGYYGEEPRTFVDEDGFIHTGDLGYRANDDLYITGRKKDIIIKGGLNLMPWAIEEIAGSVAGVRSGCVVALGLRDDRLATERVVVVAETKLDMSEHVDLTTRVRSALNSRGILVDQVLFVKPGRLPKTTSGKLNRSRAAIEMREGRFQD